MCVCVCCGFIYCKHIHTHTHAHRKELLTKISTKLWIEIDGRKRNWNYSKIFFLFKCKGVKLQEFVDVYNHHEWWWWLCKSYVLNRYIRKQKKKKYIDLTLMIFKTLDFDFSIWIQCWPFAYFFSFVFSFCFVLDNGKKFFFSLEKNNDEKCWLNQYSLNRI